MTLPAVAVGKIIEINACFNHQIMVFDQLFMAAYTIILNNLLALFFDKNGLGLITGSKYISMSCPVFCFKCVFPEKVIMWHMAIAAGGHLPVGAVIPGKILG